MMFLLSSENVFKYLVEQGLSLSTMPPVQIELQEFRNFNLLLTFSSQNKLLVKQERLLNHQGETLGYFWKEWRIQELLQSFSELNSIHPLVSKALYFDANHSILVMEYFSDTCNLSKFYDQEAFSSQIATALGIVLATVHGATLNRESYRTFLGQNGGNLSIDSRPNFQVLSQIGPEVFGMVCADAIEIFQLYQRDEKLGKSVLNLDNIWNPCCLIHRDLGFRNILINHDWQSLTLPVFSLQDSPIRIIDWEMFTWGDPAYDVGTILANYLKIWLSSLVVNRGLDISTSLRLATIPLEQIRPSLKAFLEAYWEHSSEVRYPDFLKHVMQFAGFNLLENILQKIDDHEPLGNTGISTLQVVKCLLCTPKQSVAAIFGSDWSLN